jgi:hypothetical protein
MSNFPEFVLAPADTIAAEIPFPRERRKRVRTTVHWPILIFRNEATDGIESTTHNLSSTGFFCFSRKPLDTEETVFCTFRIPAYDPQGRERLWIMECRARVKRVEKAIHEGLFGLACEFVDYRLLASQHPTIHT